MELAVQIVRFVEEHQPPIVQVEFMDVEGRRHTFIDKVAIFTVAWLSADSKYPQSGVIRCETVARLQDSAGREIVKVTTLRPDSIESVEGLSEFLVLPNQLSGRSRV